MSSIIIATIVSVLLFEAVVLAMGRVGGDDWQDAADFAVFMHVIVGCAAVLVLGLSLLWMWALP